MRKPTFCICENKDADQLRGNREADQRLCIRYMDSTIPLLSKSEISSLSPSSVAVQPGLCRTRSETGLFSHDAAHICISWKCLTGFITKQLAHYCTGFTNKSLSSDHTLFDLMLTFHTRFNIMLTQTSTAKEK